jgi:acetolactate synthase I/II/III large subunit
MPLAGHALVQVLAAGGVRRFYTVPGESFLEVLDGVERDERLTLISTRHESGASFAAEADARMTGIPAVAMATRGVGAANLAIGVHSAQQSSTPMVALLGQVETPNRFREAFQEVDLPAFYGPITKWSATVPDAKRFPDMAAHALQVATTGRPGPVMLALPSDLLGETIDDFDPADLLRSTSRPRPRPAREEVQAVADVLNSARRPVLVAGGGTRRARAELVAVAEAFDVGVYAAFRRQDVFPNDHPLYLGNLGVGTDPATLASFEQADVVLGVGTRFDEMTTNAYTLPVPASRVLQIDIDPRVLGAVIPVEVGVVADAAEALRDLLPLAAPPVRDYADAHQVWDRAATVGEDRARPGGPLDAAQVVARLALALPEDAVVTNDAGNFSGFLHRYLRFSAPDSQVGPTSGAMGYAVPAALGAKLAAPERTVVAVAGDGGFLMSGQELETSVRMGAPFVTVVFRNGIYGTIAMHQARANGHIGGCDIAEVDVAAFARSLGVRGVTVRTLEELSETLAIALVSDVSFVVDVITDPDLLTPTGRLSEFLAAHG